MLHTILAVPWLLDDKLLCNLLCVNVKGSYIIISGLKLFFFPQLWDVPAHVNHHRRVAINDGVSYVEKEKKNTRPSS